MGPKEARDHCVNLTHERSLYQKDRDAIRTLLDYHDALLAMAAESLKTKPGNVLHFVEVDLRYRPQTEAQAAVQSQPSAGVGDIIELPIVADVDVGIAERLEHPERRIVTIGLVNNADEVMRVGIPLPIVKSLLINLRDAEKAVVSGDLSKFPCDEEGGGE